MGIPERLLKNLSWLFTWVPSPGTGFRLHLEKSIFSISGSDPGLPPSFVKLVPSWLKHALLIVCVKEFSAAQSCALLMNLWYCTCRDASTSLMGEAAFINRKIWIAGDEGSEWCSSQVNHDPEPLLGCLSCFTLSATDKDERKQEINLKRLLLSKNH